MAFSDLGDIGLRGRSVVWKHGGGVRRYRRGEASLPTWLSPVLSADGKVTSAHTSMSWSDARSPASDSSRFSRMVKAGAIGGCLVVSAGLLSMDIAARNHPWLAWCTLLPLLAVVRLLSPRLALACGALWGSSLYLFLASAADPVIQVTAQSFALLSITPAVYALFGAWFTRRFGFNPLILGLGWAGVELALMPLGLGGGLLLGTLGQAVGTVGQVLEHVFGYVCMAAFIAAVNGLVIAILTRAYARIVGSQPHVRGTSDILQPFFLQEVPAFLLLLIRPSRPRAPPLP